MARELVTRVDVCATEEYAGRCPEEGYPRYRRVFAVVVDLQDGRQFVFGIYYRDEDEAERLAARVREAGTIDPDLWQETTPPTWQELEYEWEQVAVHERLGLPL